MPGIDLIDLNDPLLRKRDKKALRLILHPSDAYVSNGKEFWYLWTAKEAVFKAKRDLTNFAPKEIPIQINSDSLEFRSGHLKGRIHDHDNLIIAVSDTDPDNVAFHYFKRQTYDESGEARAQLITHFKNEYHIVTRVVRDGNGLPVLEYQNLPVSFTHHAGYIGFAYPKSLKLTISQGH